MATRFYPTRQAAPFTPTNWRGTIDEAGTPVTHLISTTKGHGGSPTYDNITNVICTELSSTNPWRRPMYRGVSVAMTSAGTLSGTFDVCLGLFEDGANHNVHWGIHIYVTVGASDTVRGTALANYNEATNEWPDDDMGGPGEQGFSLAAPQTLTPVAYQIGDHVVWELIPYFRNTFGGAFQASGIMRFGTTTGAGVPMPSDLTPGDANTTTKAGWIEFSADLFNVNAPPVVDAGPDQNLQWPTSCTTLAGSITDDGIPGSPAVTGLWTKVSGPGTVTWDDDTDPESGVCVSGHGVYVLRLTGDDGALTAFDDVTLTFAVEDYPPSCPSGDWELTINGLDRTSMFKLEQVSIEYTLGSPGQLRCLLVDTGPPSAAVRPQAEDIIVVSKGVRVFTGKVVATDETSLVSPNVGTGTTISAVDYQRALSKRLFTGSYGQYQYILETPPVGGSVILRSSGDNNDLLFETREKWSGVNNYQIEMVDPGASSVALSVVHDPPTNTTIILATDGGGAIVTTAADIVAIIEFVTPGLLFASLTVDDPSGNDGSGIVSPVALTNFSGGSDRTWELITERRTNYIIPNVGLGTTTVGTIYPHGLTTGDKVRFTGTTDVTPDISGIDYAVTVTTPSEFTIPFEVTSGGQVGQVHQLTALSVVLGDMAPIFANYGITLSAPSASTVYVMPIAFTRQSVESVLKTLCDLFGWVYRITPYKVLEIFAPGDKVASFTLSTANSNVVGPAPQRRTRETYANQLYVTGGKSGEVSLQRDPFVADGSQVTYPLPDPNAWQQIHNMTHPGYIIVSGVSAPLTAIHPTDVGFEWSFNPTTKTIHHNATPLTLGTVVEFAYWGDSAFVVIVPDVTPSGEIYNDEISAGETASKALAREIGLAELVKRSATERRATLNTFECFALPGTAIPVDISDRLMADEWLTVTSRMQSMNARRNGEDAAKYTFDVLEEGLPTTWVDFWKRR